MNAFRFHHGWLVILCFMLAVDVAFGQPEPPRTAGAVELSVRSPQGKPLVHAPVEIMPLKGDHPFELLESSWFETSRTKAMTDALGVARFSWPVGVERVRVIAKGVGYGGTGVFEVPEGRTARPHLPPLIPYAVIEETVPKELLQPGAYVTRVDSFTQEEARAPPRSHARKAR